MKKAILFFIFATIQIHVLSQTVCDPNANVVLFSNYDGGVLNINVDVNIPNLKIGVVSYEMVTINLSVPFVNNITEVRFAGYTTTTHNHCNNTPPVTSIVGAPPGTDTIIFMPQSPVSNANGYHIIICNTSCDTTTSQGGCNTADQTGAYFLQEFGGTLRYHLTQYNCWSGSYNISSGGNCCIGAAPSSGAPLTLFNSSDTSFCEKKCIDFFDLSTNSPIAWQWYFPGADTLTSNLQNPTGICYSNYGSFDVTLIACNTIGCDTLTVTNFIQEFQSPSIPVVISNFDTLFSTPAFSYQWYNSSGIIIGATGQYYVYPAPGSYFVLVSDTNGCASSSAVIYTSVENIHSDNRLSIYPNPSNGDLFINCSRIHITAVKIYDQRGRAVYAGKFEEGKNHIRLDLDDGIYFLEAVSDKNIIREKFIIIR